MNLIQPYFKKIISYKFDAHNLKFMVSQNLFSSQVIDYGTQRLLRTLLFENVNNFNKALDLGCGYGPIGIILKKINPKSEVQMVDSDALAIEYTKANAELNDASQNLTAYGSLGYDSVKDTNFDLIVSNIPAKVGEKVLSHMIKDAGAHLTNDGRVIIVVIDSINGYIHKELISDEHIKILYHQAWPGHHVYHYTFIKGLHKDGSSLQNAFEKGEYKRQENKFRFKNSNFILETTFHLPEFNKLSYDTNLLLSCIEKVKSKTSNILIFSPGQGYIPLAITKQFNPDQIFLVDRDLQALQISHSNLMTNGYSNTNIKIYHQVGISLKNENVNMIIGILPEQQNIEVYKLYIEQASMQLKQGELLILSSSSTIITRVEQIISKNHLNFLMIKRERSKGRSAILLSKLK
jgi:16S rRNA G1207 methylase RsmC